MKPNEIKELADQLEYYQAWCRDPDLWHPNPDELALAVDKAIALLRVVADEREGVLMSRLYSQALVVEIEVGKELGRFESHAQWINHAPRVYAGAYAVAGSRDVITLDSATPRRVMVRGKQFNRAHDESTYPVVIYAIG